LSFLTAAEDMPPPHPLPPPPPPPRDVAPPPPERPPARPRAPPEPEPEPESEPEEAAPAADEPREEDQPEAAVWPDEFEGREGAEAGAEADYDQEFEAPALRAPRRRLKLPRAVMRTLLVLLLGGVAAGAYWWFQPELPLPQLSSITAVGSTIGAKVSALGDKVVGLVAGLRRRPP